MRGKVCHACGNVCHAKHTPPRRGVDSRWAQVMGRKGSWQESTNKLSQKVQGLSNLVHVVYLEKLKNTAL